MTISERIFEILKQRKITQKQFAQMTGITQSTISDWKRKGTNPSADKIMTICEALQVTPYDVLGEAADKIEPKVEGDYLIVSKGTEEYVMVNEYRALDEKYRQRVLGYVRALNQEM